MEEKKVEVKWTDIDALKIICRESLEAFIMFIMPDFILKDFHKQLIRKLEDLEFWRTKNLLASMPPGAGKSLLITQLYSVWHIGRNQLDEVMVVWYSSWLVEEHSFRARDLMMTDEFKFIFWDILNPNSMARSEWKYWTGKGAYRAIWVDWTIIWKRYNVWILDDLYNWMEDADKKETREKIWKFYTSVFLDRWYWNDAKKIVIMTRWNQDDLIWRLLELQGEKWDKYSIPAIENIEDEEVNWKSFFPEMFSVERLIEQYKIKPLREWESLYMCNPLPDGDGLFKKENIMYYNEAVIKQKMNDFQIYTFVDPAISQKQSADYTAIVTIWINSIWQIYVLELTRARLLPTEIINKIFEHVKTYNPVAVWVETVQYQKMLAIEVKNEMIKRNSFFTLEEIKPMWEKNARIKTILEPIIEKRNLFLINQKHIEIENELYWFPAWKHDDAIDALSWAITMWNWKMNRGIAKVYDEWELTGGLYY